MMTTAPDLIQMVNLALGTVLPLLAGVCAVLCFVNRHLSSRLMILGAGFLLDCLVGLVSRLGTFVLNYFATTPSPPERIGMFFSVMFLGYIVAFALIVIGLALSLGDIARRMRRLEQDTGEPRPGFGAENVREAWQPRKEGSRDIQQ